MLRLTGACEARSWSVDMGAGTGTEKEQLQRVSFDHVVEGKKVGVFVAMTAWVWAYEDYDDPTMSAEMRDSLHPVVLMIARWDGQNGFIGGFNDATDQLRKEMMEEAGANLSQRDLDDLHPLIAHEAEWIVVRLYHMNLGVISVADAKLIQARAAMAEHSVSEGSAGWRHLSDYGRGKGWETLRRGCLATAVGEELDALRDRIYENPPAGAWPKVSARK